MKRKITLAAIFFVFAMGAVSLLSMADPPPGMCKHVQFWIVGSPEQGCLPIYCQNPLVIGMDHCYAHWGAPQIPTPPQCE